MVRKVVSSLLLGFVVVALSAVAVRAQNKAEMVANPMYKGWSSFKKGTTVQIEEVTTFGDADKGAVPAAGDVKIINYKLQDVNDKRAIVTTTVVENEFLSTIESAATKITYAAEVNKADFDRAWHDAGAKLTDGKVKVLDKDVECKIVAMIAKNGPEEVSRKIAYSKDVPGGIVERVTTTKRDGKLVAETVTKVKAYKVAE